MKVFLWMASIFHLVFAIWAACSVNEDCSNAAVVMVITFAFFAGSVIDAFAAIHIGERERDTVYYAGGKYERK